MAKFEIKDGVAIIPEGTTEISNYAFDDCRTLESIVIPESVTEIGYAAFFRCVALKSIIIPESVTKIDEAAFVGCSSLENIVVAEGNPVYDSREGCNAIVESKTNILRYGSKSTNIPQSVTKIGRHAFAGCSLLESVTIPEAVTEIEDYAFCDCRLLESIAIPKLVTKIGNSAFKGCKSLKSIIIPDSVTEIDSLAFLGCNSLKCVTFLSRTKLGAEVFSYSSRITINVPRDCVDYYKEVLPEEFHDNIVEFEPEKKTKVNHLEIIKEIARHLGTIIEKIDSLDFCPIIWEDSFALLYELRDTVERIDKLSEQLEPIFFDDSFWNDPQNKDIVENIEEADKCFNAFSWHFSRIDSVLEEEGPKEWYDIDYEYLSAQLKKAKQHLDLVLKNRHMTKYFTKSAFKMSLECPRKLYYAYDKGVYANQDLDDDFLKSLTEGGFQVGEFAKLCYGIGEENTISTLKTEEAITQTKELFCHDNINIAEAAFLYENMLVRVDVIEKKGNVINLIEVKAKSWNPLEDSFLSKQKNTNATNSKIRPYLYDVAFQKYVVVQALSKMFPKEHFTVHAFLMMADKTRTATVNGLNQLFKVKTTPEGRSYVETAPEAMEIVASIPLAERVVRPFDVDEICDNIINGEYDEQRDLEFMVGGCFNEHVMRMANDYCNHKKSDCIIGSKCFSCQFRKKPTDSDKMLDGYCECWNEKAGFDPSKEKRALIQDLNGQYIRKDMYIKGLKYFMNELTEDDLKKHSGNPHDGLDHYEKKWLQIGIATQNKEILSDFQSDMVGDVYLDIDGIKKEMQTWQFPLHFIDFETSAVALPFYDKMRPYEQIAFQFSHHRVDRNEDGTYTVTHAGQFINTTPGHFPNFDFIRALKAELDKDQGTIFRYSHHENTILREIHRQLDVHDAPDKRELQAFIDSITHYKVGSGKSEVTYAGVRDMVDLAAVVYKYYYHPLMNGGFSIKVVLPSVLNSSDFIKAKYSQPIYGTPEMPSCNLSSPKSWIEYGEDKVVKNPYKLLPTISSYLGIDVNLDDVEIEDGESVANGAAALMAYAKMQFSEGEMLKALEQALLTYCELDTLAMVFIWEYFYKECNK